MMPSGEKRRREKEEEEEEKEEEAAALLTSQEPFKMISELLLAKFTVKKKWLLTDGRTNPLIEIHGRI